MQSTIFIGHHKTGSTALQHALAVDAARLVSEGVLYPAVEFQGMAYLAAALAGRGGAAPLNYAQGHNALGFKMIAEGGGGPVPDFHPMLPHSTQMKHAIAEQVARFAPKRLILASEVFANFGAISSGHIDEIARIAGPKAEVVVVLRRPDDYLVSWHLQRLRFGHHVGPIAEEIRHYAGTIHLDYRKMIAPWMDRFEVLHVVPYAEVKAAGGLPSWFGGRLGLSLAETAQNVGLHRGFAEIARRAVIELGPEGGRGMLDWLHRVRIDLPTSDQIELLGHKARREIRRGFEPVHDWLSALTGRAAFFDDLDQSVEPLPFAEEALRPVVIERLLATGQCPQTDWLERQR